VDRHRRKHLSVALTGAIQRRAEFEVDQGDDLLDQMKALTRDLRRALEDAKQAKSLSAFLQVTDRMQKQVALQSQLLERPGGVSDREIAFSWKQPVCPLCGHEKAACEAAHATRATAGSVELGSERLLS
jgi:hypothetical protein